MRCLPVCLDEDTARQCLHTASWWRRCFPRRQESLRSTLDLVWIPHYLCTFQMESAKDFGETTVSVDACSGAFAIFQMEEDLLHAPPEGGETLPGQWAPEDAEKLGRDKLLQAIMRRRGSQGPKPVPGALVKTELVLFPFWVAYIARGRDGRDIRLLNAATGERGGNQTKAGVLHAFVAKSKRGG